MTQPSLYSVLSVQPSATPAEITKAYRALALKLHPDKQSSNIHDSTDTTDHNENFINLKKAYEILSNPDKRKLYDETGSIGEEESFDFSEFSKVKITTADIDAFEKLYKGSDEEKEDLISFYDRFQGDISYLLECVPFSEPEDIPRFLEIFSNLFNEKKLNANYKPAYEKSLKTLDKSVKKYSKSKSKVDIEADESSLIESIKSSYRKRASDFDAMIADLQTKALGKKKKTKK
jgi:DnaJ homolog subfamily C member 9